jgi:hypothetical protein
MASAGAPNREGIIGAIVLVFAQSKLKDLVGSDPLRSVLSGQYRDLVQDGTLHLQVIWDLLEDQPGFEREDAEPVFCVLKSWQEDFQLEVEMPKVLADLGEAEIMGSASHCPVPGRLKERALFPEGAKAKAKASMAAFDTGHVAKTNIGASTRKPALEALLGVIAIAGLGFGGYTLQQYLRGPNIKTISASNIATEIPISSAKRLGGDLSLVVSNDNWFALPAAERIAMLQATLRGVSSFDIKAMVILNSAGKMRASAQWMGEPPKIDVRLD